MSALKFESCLAIQIQALISLRRVSGSDYQSQAKLLEYFDRFLVAQGVSEPRITREITDAYQQSISHLCRRGQQNRFSLVRQLCEYVARTDPLMGHVDIHSTQVYLRPTAELWEQVAGRFHKHYLDHVKSQGGK